MIYKQIYMILANRHFIVKELEEIYFDLLFYLSSARFITIHFFSAKW